MITLYLAIIMSFFFQSLCYAEKDYSQLAYKIINHHAKDAKKINNLILIGSGGSWATDVKLISISYWSYLQLDIPSSRRLYIQTVERLIHDVNVDKEIRPYLRDYPFIFKNTKVDIGFIEKGFQNLNKKKIKSVVLINGIVYYDILDENEKLKTVHQEPYEEALRIVRAENPLAR